MKRQYVRPNLCYICCDPADKYTAVSDTHSAGTITTYSLEVAICNNCQRRQRIARVGLWIIYPILFVLLLAAGDLLSRRLAIDNETSTNCCLPLTIALFILAVYPRDSRNLFKLAWLSLVHRKSHKLSPNEWLKNSRYYFDPILGSPTFANKEYDRIFKEMNRLVF